MKYLREREREREQRTRKKETKTMNELYNLLIRILNDSVSNPFAMLTIGRHSQTERNETNFSNEIGFWFILVGFWWGSDEI